MTHVTNRSNPGAWDGKPYNFFGDYLKDRFKTRVLKLPLDAGLGCPNRDGTLGSGGCVFCSEEGSAPPHLEGTDGLHEQMTRSIESFRRADASTQFIAYFQAYTNTYAPLPHLKELYDTALSGGPMAGLMIGTRPDCLDNDVLDLIKSYDRDDFELWLEIGMQTMHEKSLYFLNRRHSHGDTRDAVRRAAERRLKVCLHIILGIPGETWEDMMDTAVEISSLPVQGVKLHHLHVIKGTPLEDIYNECDMRLPDFREYVSTVCDFLERLCPDILVHRLLGDRDEDSLVAPLWGLHKGTVLKAIEDEFQRRGSRQGHLREGEM